MTKAQFLAFSLPFGLFCQVLDKGNDPKFVKLSAVYNDGSCSFFDTIESNHGFSSVKPLLFPLTDFEKLNLDITDEISIMNRIEKKDIIGSLDFSLVLRLIEEHFDILGLIENDEAINVNSLANFHY